MYQPKVLVLAGDGINCENETSLAFEEAGGKAEILPISQLTNNPDLLLDYQIFALPGGFSFADELGSGQILALKLKQKMMNEFNEFRRQKKPIIGICNGFQVLMKLGAFEEGNKTLGLASNIKGQFINDWKMLKINHDSNCIWLNEFKKDNITSFPLPVRHGEGRVVGKYHEGFHHNQICFSYENNFNGSLDNIAGICDSSGLILGMMPHPEGAVLKNQLPINYFSQYEKVANKIFSSAIKYFL